MKPFLKQLEARAQAATSLLCVGLDPHPELLPDHSASAAREFCLRLIDATADFACAFKPNSAFFEALGSQGYVALAEIIVHVPRGIPVILDAKRGDIASTAEAYARSAFDVLGATAITLSPYLGYDSIEPFIRRPERGAFILCKTSNPGADEFQNLWAGGRPLYEAVAERVMTWNAAGNVGLVVGATDPQALARVRQLAPDAWFLVPGVGAQGGDLAAAVQAGLRADGMGLLINASRSIATASDPGHEARRLRDAINAASIHRPSAQPATSVDMLARALAESGCVRFGSFTLKSGLPSPIYLDLRRLVSYPRALQVVAAALDESLRGLRFDHMAGIPYAALPIATAVAVMYGRSLIYPRREAKEYGTKATIEGVYAVGDVAVVIDDLATTGGTKFEIVERLKSAGLVVNDIVVVIDREQGAAETIRAAGYGFHAVATLRQLLDSWQAQGFLSTEQRQQVDGYLAEQSR
jgi:uridine monophosphate synthetase